MPLKTLTRGALIAAAVATAALAPQAPARTILGGPPDLERLVRGSDVICVAEVQDVRTEFVDRRIETTYTLEVEDFLAGSGPETFDMTVLGGAVEEPFPMAFVFDGMVVLSEQQDVLLFLSDRSANGASPALQRAQASGVAPSFGDALTPVLGDLGVFTVVTDPRSGQRYVTQINYGMMGAAVTPQVNSLVVQRVESSVATRSGGQPQRFPLTDRAINIADTAQAQAISGSGDSDEAPALLPSSYTREDLDRLMSQSPLPTPDRATRAAAPADEGEDASAVSSPLRTLGDMTAEIEHLVNQGGRN